MSQSPKSNLARYVDHLKAEVDGAALYRGLADSTEDATRKAVLLELAQSEEAHAARWRLRIQEEGGTVPDFQPSRRVRLLCRLAKWFGPQAVLPAARLFESDGVAAYASHDESRDLAREERGHARVFAQMSRPAGAADIMRRETWHRTAGGGSLRAAVFGVNDGLCSNLSLIMGVAGANPSAQLLLLTGIAGLLAGAFSMAAGEYVSMRAQRELFERQLAIEKEELETSPEEEQHELALIYRAKGLPKQDAERMAALLLADKQAGLDTLAREELGLDPEELGSPWGAAISSFVAFAIGAIVPVAPFFVMSGEAGVIASGVLGSLSLLMVGGSLSLFTGKNPLVSALRMLAIGWAAAAVTFGIGRLIGVSLAG